MELEIIDYLQNQDLVFKDNVNYSTIKFNISTEKCSSCSIDGYTVILNDKNLFNAFINIKSIFVYHLFNIILNIKNLFN